MRLQYHYCAEAVDCEACFLDITGRYGFELHRHEYDPYEYDLPTHKWLCSEACVKAWNEREPAEPDYNAPTSRERAEMAYKIKRETHK